MQLTETAQRDAEGGSGKQLREDQRNSDRAKCAEVAPVDRASAANGRSHLRSDRHRL